MQRVLSIPRLYSIELTPQCNNRCPGCFNVFVEDKTRRSLQRRSILLVAQWRIILAKIRPHAERVRLTGGEPTLHPDFEEIARALAEFKIPFAVLTNARWRHPRHLMAFLKDTPGFSGFLVSLHGASAMTHDYYTGRRGSFDQAVRNIRLAVESGLEVATSTVIHSRNYTEIGAIVALAGKLGTTHAVINRYLGTPMPDIEPNDAQLRTAVLQVERLSRAGAPVKLGNCIPGCFVENSSSGCLAGVAYCAISPWGEMRPCNHSPRVVGNLLTQSVEKAWNSTGMQQWRKLMPSECESKCALFGTCHGACRAALEVRQDRRDPLRRSPLPSVRRSVEPVHLYEGLRPLARFHLRREGRGYVALRGSRIVPIGNRDSWILQECDGNRTLRDIEQNFGAKGLQLVNLLHDKGLIEFEEDLLDAPDANIV